MSAVLTRPAPRTGRSPTFRRPGRPHPLDLVHDHVLRTVGDPTTARQVVVDIVLRANARAVDLGEAPTAAVLLRHARARLAAVPAAGVAAPQHAVGELLRAPNDLHALLVAPPRRPLRRLVWLAPIASVLAVAAATLTGLPDAVAAVTADDVPVATAEAVTGVPLP